MRVVIVGSGPAGLFAAHELAGKADVTIIDKGKDVKKRSCPSPNKCKGTCRPCNILCGVGGAGLFSDGKIIFSTKIGNNLDPIVGSKKNSQLVQRVADIFNKYGIKIKELSNEDKCKIKELKRNSRMIGGDFLYEPQAHVGTDKLISLITEFKKDLEDQGVEFIYKQNVSHNIKDCNLIVNKKKINYDALILAPGRIGATWLEEVVRCLNINYSYNPIDIGVRVEVAREITDHITNVVRDMKFYLRSNTYEDLLRTFCTCPGGNVTRETHDGFNLVNGHSKSGDPSSNTNFAFLVTMPLNTPQSNTNLYGQAAAKLGYVTGAHQPLLQRLGDLKRGRRSHESKKNTFLVKPSLEDVIYGDIGLALPYRICLDLIEGLDKLNQIIPGIASDSTLLYAPEIKFHGLKVKTDKYLMTNKEGIYVAGDGAGLSRGIAGAACCGVLTAEGIIKKYLK